ncbi:triacylglycerol lipase [Pseudomonas sp. LS1212]|uniref:esterase/lipase family protein n=1 Tax=Pseudomonas sp. LS1212 TaxID=2972478 RepID=UPI00215CADB6|nr:triacylglycerol lipase [Pseudomonas sp. LS1212]UVJ46454.1 triacylglycerol lipase [Pseudomonas sp. LS1212]
MAQALSTRYPLVMVPGMLGFVRLLLYPYWFGIPAALRRGGAQVFVVQVSPVNSNEVRGEQLLRIIERIRRETGADKVNLIGHSQGALTARYAAAKYPQWIASVTSVAGPNRGSELADYYVRRYPADSACGRLLALALRVLAGGIWLLETGQRGPLLPIDVEASHRSLTSEGAALFNRQYPQGVPTTWGGRGAEEVNGVRYYSWSGIVQDKRSDSGGNRFDGSHFFCRLNVRGFFRERECDGMVGRLSSHLGQVIGDDYPLDHLDIVNQSLGLVGKGADPVRLFTEHAARLKAAGL